MTSTRNLSAARKWGTLAICCVASLVLGIDNTVVNLAFPHLVRDMDPSSTQLLWIADAYGFALGGLVIVMGSLGDRFGRKRLLLLGGAGFALASALTAEAPSAGWLIAARALQGVAGATLMPSTLSLVRNAFTDPKERTMAMGIAGGVGAAGFALGPVVGGPLLDHFWWGSVFLINVPVMALVLAVGGFVLVESRNPNPGRIDWRSVPLSCLGMVATVYALKTAARDGLDRPAVWIAAALGVVLLTGFVLRQRRVANPLVDVDLLRSRGFSGAIAANTLSIFALAAQSLAASLYFQDVRGYSPMGTGFALLLGPLGAMVTGPLCPVAVKALGRARAVGLGLVLMAVSCFGYLLVGVATDYWVMGAVMFVSGLGIGLVFGIGGDTMLASAPKERAGAASAVESTATELGGALGIAVLGSLLTAVYRNRMTPPAGIGAQAESAAHESIGGAVAAAHTLPAPLGHVLTAASQHAFVDGFHAVVAAGGVVLLLGTGLVVGRLRGVPAVIAEESAEAEGERGTESTPAAPVTVV
ncbi:MFS transporter [Streptacidiphilus jiangxiensis]|uniref:MFS transporter, DHA2 family, multidrug resistance protein n=1 Tax=Streptacidiphilus jiangxiensis TaxID=235985 RepID=A0A1H7J985_STRJI|nr:MFS transporter [Streptacidiphilus jiangxiensis]SEK69815.1 MFS transporter, DHA2 family, multidrug resistance protein [Streptacidiphilus jiangxiensis]